MKIATRLWLPTLTVTSVLAVMAVCLAMRSNQQEAQADAQLLAQQSKLLDAATWQGLTNANAARVIASVMSGDPSVEAALKPEIEASTARISEIAQRIDAAATDADEKAALVRIAQARKVYIDARNNARKAKTEGDAAAAQALLSDQVRPAVSAYLSAQQAYVAMQQAHAEVIRAQAGAQRKATLWAAVGTMALLMLGLAIATLLQVRSICRPMYSLAAIARRIGEGDLEVEVDTRRSDEIGAVSQSLAAMRDALRDIVGPVRQAAESIQLASAEVASGNTDLSQRTEQAASSLQQTASSTEQLAGNVRQSADAADQAKQLAASASVVARRGGEVVSQVVSTMDEINGSSKRIADIVGTIDGIAFQTNILALNAAVEAARAGEQGRGFAVVAAEVRSLAQRSASAAREIKTLIGASVDKVETGARLVRDAGATMGEIVTSVQRVTDVIGEISAAAREQDQRVGEVNSAVNSLDQMTQQNAALVEQSAAAAESLREQAQRLATTMQRFRFAGDPVSSVAGGRLRPASGSSVIARPSPPAKATAALTARKPAARTAITAPRPAYAAQAAIARAIQTSRQAAPVAALASVASIASVASVASDDWESF
jgi:methyl-accepting chemotaxis protein